MREVKKLAEVDPRFWTHYQRDFICDSYVLAKAAQHGSKAAQREAIERPKNFVQARRRWDHPEVLRVANRIDSNLDGIVAFVTNPRTAADNNASERDIRPLASATTSVVCTSRT